MTHSLTASQDDSTPGARWTAAVDTLLAKAAMRGNLHQATRRFTILAAAELEGVVSSSDKRELLVGAVFSPFDKVLLAFTGTFKALRVPLSWVTEQPVNSEADPTRLSVTQAGRVLVVGKREISTQLLVKTFGA